MSRHIDKEALVAAVMSSTELDNEQKSQLIRLIREQKKYGLVWEDSTEDAWEKMKESIPVLKEDETKRITAPPSAPEGATIAQSPCPNHAIIEADNLHALIALSYTHAGMIDVIYIDPPYNTGNKDFVYNDSFIGEDDAYRHSKWLSFMEKRLQIAKTLLSEKGVIFISIDDNEQANLKLLCENIFGSSNYITCFPWHSRQSLQNDTDMSVNHEYLVCFAKNRRKTDRRLKPSNASTWYRDCDFVFFPLKVDNEKYDNPDNDPRGPWKADPFDAPNVRPNLTYPIINPSTGEQHFPPTGRHWRMSSDKFEQAFSDSRILFGKNGKGRPQLKVFLSEQEQYGSIPNSWFEAEQYGTATHGSKELQGIFDGEKPFTSPKPTSLLREILKLVSIPENPITILDFFAGSGTTLHATMQLNAEDGGHRQCILVTNNENNICEEVTYERNKRVIEGYTTPKGEQVAGLNHNNLRYYKLDFNPRKQSHQDNRELFYGLKDLLCIKENIYQEKQLFGSLSLAGKEQMLRYFAENGREMLMVYDTRVIPFIVNEIAQRGEQEQPLKIYIFADGAYPYTDDFASVVDKVSLVPMPYAYYRGIKDSLPEETTTKVDDTELTDEEQQTMMAEAIAFESKE